MEKLHGACMFLCTKVHESTKTCTFLCILFIFSAYFSLQCGKWLGPDGLFFFSYLLFYSFILEIVAYYSFHSTYYSFILPIILVFFLNPTHRPKEKTPMIIVTLHNEDKLRNDEQNNGQFNLIF